MRTYRLTFIEDSGDGMPEEFTQQRVFSDSYSSDYNWEEEDQLSAMFMKLMEAKRMSDEEKFAVVGEMLDNLIPSCWTRAGEREFPALDAVNKVFRDWRWRSDENTYRVSIYDEGPKAREDAKELLTLGAKKDGLWRVLERMFELEQEWKTEIEEKNKKLKEDYDAKCCSDPSGDNCGSDG